MSWLRNRMQKLKVIFHIGTEKTGTTSIQNFIRANRDLIKNQGTTTSPGIIGNQNNFELVLAVEDTPGADLAAHRNKSKIDFKEQFIQDTQRLISEDEAVTTILYSSEHLSSRLVTEESIQSLKKLFPVNTDFEIIVYLKRQEQLYLGYFAEAMKAGIPYNKIVKMNDIMARERYGAAYYDYSNLLARWEKVFGLKAIKVRVFDTSFFYQNDLISDFIQSINLDPKNLKVDFKESNPSLSPECLFYLNDICDKFSTLPRHKVISILEQVDYFKKGSFFTDDQLASFVSGFDDSNNRVFERYTGKPNPFLFKKSTMRYVNVSEIAESKTVYDKIVSIFSRLHN